MALHWKTQIVHLILATNFLEFFHFAVGLDTQPCGDGDTWRHFDDQCYHAGRGAKSWFQARRDCLDIGGDLVSIKSAAERDFVLDIIPNTYPDNIWIGLYEADSGKHIWSDGSPEVYFNFAKGQPDDNHGSERCVIMSKDDGLWRDQNCMKGWNSFVCKKHDSNKGPATLPPPIEGSCPDGFISEPFSKKCFFLGGTSSNTDKKSWRDARIACKAKNSKADLASISTVSEQAFVSLLIEDVDDDVWIGLNKLEAFDTHIYTWIDSSEILYTNWASGRPTYVYELGPHHKARKCVVMKRDPVNIKDTTKWSNEDCDDVKAYLCQVSREPNKKEDKKPFERQYIGLFCKDGYFAYHGRCYKFHPHELSWSDASKFCNDRSQELAVTMDTFEAARLYYETWRYFPSPRIWIGVRFDPRVGEYISKKNYEVPLTLWDTDEPNLQTQHSCVSIFENLWDDISCFTKLPFFCVEGGYDENRLTTPHPTAGRCEDADSVGFADHCYFVPPVDTVSWSEASRLCAQRGMEMTSVHSHSEMRFLISLMHSARKDGRNLWIGLLQGLDSGYLWADGSPRNYFNWAYGEPTIRRKVYNQGIVRQECVELIHTSGEWNDIHCDEERGFMCKSDKVFLTDTATSRSIDTTTSTVSDKKQLETKVDSAKGQKSAHSQVSWGLIVLICLCVLLSVITVGLVLTIATDSGRRWARAVRDRLARPSSGDKFDKVVFKNDKSQE